MARDTKPKKKAAAKPAKKSTAKPAKKVADKPAKKAAGKAGRLPVPVALAPIVKGKAGKRPEVVRRVERRLMQPLEGPSDGEATVLDRLWQTVESRRLAGDVENSHSARLIARGTSKVAQKLGEEAVECVIEAIQGNRAATILESADLLYHLVVVWVDAGIRPEEVWAELRRREGISGIAEKAARPKGIVRAARTTKLP
jgi:phosphoribosyl-ATP pyrophosphohydrolase